MEHSKEYENFNYGVKDRVAIQYLRYNVMWKTTSISPGG